MGADRKAAPFALAGRLRLGKAVSGGGRRAARGEGVGWRGVGRAGETGSRRPGRRRRGLGARAPRIRGGRGRGPREVWGWRSRVWSALTGGGVIGRRAGRRATLRKPTLLLSLIDNPLSEGYALRRGFDNIVSDPCTDNLYRPSPLLSSRSDNWLSVFVESPSELTTLCHSICSP